MKDLTFCKEWGEKLAARHPEDLSPEERVNLHQHLSECLQCSEAYTAFSVLENRIRDLPQAVSLPDIRTKLQSIQQEYPPTTSSMSILRMLVQCSNRFFEISPNEVENAELMVEDVVSRVLLDLFDEGIVDDVTIQFSSNVHKGLQQCSIQVHARCSTQHFVLLPRTKENIELAVEKNIGSLLRELFGWVNIDSVTLVPPRPIQSERSLLSAFDTGGEAFA